MRSPGFLLPFVTLLASAPALADGQQGNVPLVQVAVREGGELQVVAARRHEAILGEAARRPVLPWGKVKMVPLGSSATYSVPAMDGKLSFDFSAKVVKVSTTFTVKAQQNISSIYLYLVDTLSGSPVVSDASGALSIMDLGQGAWGVALGTPLATGQSATLTLTHQGTPTCQSYCMLSSGMTYNLTNSWQPIFVDTADLIYPTASTLAITLPTTMAAGASGTSATSKDNGDGTTTYTFTEKRYGRFSMGAAAYKVGTSSFGTSSQVRSFIRPPNDSYASAWRKGAVDVLTFHQNAYGPYLYGKADVVEVSDALAYAGAGGVAGLGVIFIPTMVLATDVTDWTEQVTLAHELAHQWFAFMVHNGDAYESPWLSEGFATFGEMEYTSSLGTKKLVVDYRPTYRRLTNQIYIYTMRGKTELPITSQGIYKAAAEVYAVLTYYKGALVVGLMRHLLGSDSAFFSAMKTYVSDHLTGDSTVTSLLASIKKASGKDLSGFAQQWIYNTGYPTYSTAVKRSTSSGGYAADISVTSDNDFVVPVELDLVTADGKTTRKKLSLSGTSGKLTYQGSSELIEVRLDPDHHIPGRSKGALAGDVHANGEVDGIDLITEAWAVGQSYSSKTATAGTTSVFAEWADLVFNGKIDQQDLNVVKGSFGTMQGE